MSFGPAGAVEKSGAAPAPSWSVRMHLESEFDSNKKWADSMSWSPGAVLGRRQEHSLARAVFVRRSGTRDALVGDWTRVLACVSGLTPWKGGCRTPFSRASPASAAVGFLFLRGQPEARFTCESIHPTPNANTKHTCPGMGRVVLSLLCFGFRTRITSKGIARWTIWV